MIIVCFIHVFNYIYNISKCNKIVYIYSTILFSFLLIFSNLFRHKKKLKIVKIKLKLNY